mgnify:CR=1 FL=1
MELVSSEYCGCVHSAKQLERRFTVQFGSHTLDSDAAGPIRKFVVSWRIIAGKFIVFILFNSHFFFCFRIIPLKVSGVLTGFAHYWVAVFVDLGWNFAHVQIRLHHHAVAVECQRIVSLVLENVFIHRPQSRGVLVELVMSWRRIELAQGTRLEFADVHWLVGVLR